MGKITQVNTSNPPRASQYYENSERYIKVAIALSMIIGVALLFIGSSCEHIVSEIYVNVMVGMGFNFIAIGGTCFVLLLLPGEKQVSGPHVHSPKFLEKTHLNPNNKKKITGEILA